MLRALAFADTMWGGLSRALNTNQMKAAAAGAWEQGAAPGACGWVTLYNYNTAVKAPAPEWRWAGGMPASHLLSLFSALNGLVLFGLELTVVCVFHPPSRLFSLWPECLLKEQRGSPCGRENCEVAIIRTRKGIIGIRILLGHCGN